MTIAFRDRRSVLMVLAALLPTVVIGGWLAQIVIARTQQPTLRVAIHGYDPRDLLRGHYLNFQLNLQGVSRGDDRCACLSPDPDKPLQPRPDQRDCVPTPTRGQCAYFLRVPYQPFQYYMAENAALDVERRIASRTAASPPAASVLVHFHGDGAISFSDLRLEDPQ